VIFSSLGLMALRTHPGATFDRCLGFPKCCRSGSQAERSCLLRCHSFRRGYSACSCLHAPTHICVTPAGHFIRPTPLSSFPEVRAVYSGLRSSQHFYRCSSALYWSWVLQASTFNTVLETVEKTSLFVRLLAACRRVRRLLNPQVRGVWLSFV
jgi:hypothetical protein